MALLPGPWRPCRAGLTVRCEVVVPKPAPGNGVVLATCAHPIISIGRRKLALVRVVATRGHRMENTVQGCTIRCECGTIYEVEWWDRRSRAALAQRQAVS